MKTKIMICCLLLGYLPSCKNSVEQKVSQTQTKTQLVFLSENRLEKVKSFLAKKDPYFTEAYDQLIVEANEELSKPANPVTNKTQVPPSGDIHDYMSIAPYRWPNPETLIVLRRRLRHQANKPVSWDGPNPSITVQ